MRISGKVFRRGGAWAAIFIICVLGGMPNPSRSDDTSGAFAETGIGARPLGLRAYSAVSDDAYAVFYNPAGLTQLRHATISADYADLYGLGLLKQSYFAAAIPVGGTTHALSYQNLGIDFDPFPQSYSESTLFYSIAHEFGDIGLGLNAKYFSVSSDFDQGTASGYGLDVGAIWTINERLTIGGSFRDLASRLKWGTGTTESIPSVVRVGLAYRPADRWLLAADGVGVRGEPFKELRLGTEYWIVEPTVVAERRAAREDSIFRENEGLGSDFGLALRLGFEQEFFADNNLNPSIGTTAGFGPVHLDYAFLFDNDSLGETNRFSLTYDFPGAEESAEANEEALTPPAEEAPSPGITRRRIAVLPFGNGTGEPGLDWLERGLSDIMVSELSSGRYGVDVVSSERTRAALDLGLGSTDIREVADALGATHIARGIIIRPEPGRIAVTLRIVDGETGQLVDYLGVEGGEAELFAIGQTLARESAARVLRAR